MQASGNSIASSIYLLRLVMNYQHNYFSQLNSKIYEQILFCIDRIGNHISVNRSLHSTNLSEKKESSERKEKKVSNPKTKIDNYTLKEGVYHCKYEGCTSKYKTKENLRLHIKNIHLKIKPYKCGFCELKFSHRNGKLIFIILLNQLGCLTI